MQTSFKPISSLLDVCNVENSTHLAVLFDDGEKIEKLNYKQLNELSEVIIYKLKNVFKKIRNNTAKVIVGIFSRPNVYLPVIVFALIKFPAIFVPLSLKLSSILLVHCLLNCGLRFVMVDRSIMELFLDGIKDKISVVAVTDSFDPMYTLLELDVQEKIISDRVGYIVQSSGTTGEPKKIIVPENCVMPNVTDLRYVGRHFYFFVYF